MQHMVPDQNTYCIFHVWNLCPIHLTHMTNRTGSGIYGKNQDLGLR